jgi:hypothetical protein
MSDDTNTYPAVYKAIAGLQTAIQTYTEARYQNYVQRLVSPAAAHTHAVADLREIIDSMLDTEQLRLAIMHAKEING